jgi:hypothetical protein
MLAVWHFPGCYGVALGIALGHAIIADWPFCFYTMDYWSNHVIALCTVFDSPQSHAQALRSMVMADWSLRGHRACHVDADAKLEGIKRVSFSNLLLGVCCAI